MFDQDSIWRLSQGLQGDELPQSAKSSPNDAYHVTVLTSNGVSLAKTCGLRKGRVHWEDYERAKTFNFKTHEFDTFANLCAFIDRLAPNSQKAIIYGALHSNFEGHARLRQRLLYRGDGDEDGTIVEATHTWLPIDFDEDTAPPDGIDPVNDPEGATDYVISKLPPEFHGAEHYWRLTSKAGFSPGVRMRLIFPLDRKITNSEAKRWLAGAPVDGSIYGSAQLIYTANPLFEFPVNDPITHRSGFRPGSIVEVPVIPEPVKHEHEAPDRDELDETDHEPELLAECKQIVANFVRAKGAGTTGTGGRAYRVIMWLADLRTADGLVASAGLIFDVMHEDFPETTLQYIEEKLAERDRKGTRGCKLIGSEPEEDDEPDEAEPSGHEEVVAEEPRPFLPDPAAHLAEVNAKKAELKRILRDALLNETAIKLLINATMGLGKTWSAMEAIAIDAGPPPAPGESVVILDEEDEEPESDGDMMDQDLSTLPDEDLGLPRCTTRTNQVVFVAQRHDLLKEAVEFLRDLLRARGWPDDVIDANIVIGESRERGLCLRPPDEVKLVTQASGDMRPSLCVNRGIECPFTAECKDHGWLDMKTKMATARFVFLTQAHLFSPWAPGIPGERFHPRFAKLVIVDENFTAAAIESDPTNIKAGTFRALLPADIEIRDVKLPEAGLGNLIEEALATPKPLKFLRDAGVTSALLRAAAKYRKSRERRRKIGHPGMTAGERQAFIERTEKNAKRNPRVSHLLERLAEEVWTDRDQCYSLRLVKPKSGEPYIQARARAKLWNTTNQKWIFLDGTAALSEVRVLVPDVEEVKIDAPRNAVFIQVRNSSYSKSTTLATKKAADPRDEFARPERFFKPTELLKEAVEFAELFAKAEPEPEKRPSIFVNKATRRVLMATDPGCAAELDVPDLPVKTQFRGVLLGHNEKIRGSNGFENSEVGFLIGHNVWPWQMNEAETRALHYATDRQIEFLTRDENGHIGLKREPAWGTMRNGHRVKLGEHSVHPDPDCQTRLSARCETEELQAIDRLRPVRAEKPKLFFVFSNDPLPIPLDATITEGEISDALKLFRLFDQAEARGLKCQPLVGERLREGFPELWGNARTAKNWMERIFVKQNQRVRETPCRTLDASSSGIIRAEGSPGGLKKPWVSAALMTEAGRKLFDRGWNLARYRVVGDGMSEWALLLFRGARPNRSELAERLSVAPENLMFSTLDGHPLAAEGDAVATGNARLDQALAICAEKGMALPLDPKELAGLPGSPWNTPKAAEHWKAGVEVSEILKRGPPEGWHQVKYLRTSRRGGRPSVAWVPDGAEPQVAIAAALAVPVEEIKLVECPEEGACA